MTDTFHAYSIVLENTLEVIRAAELADVNIRRRTVAAIHRGTLAVVAGAEQRAPKRTGELAWTIRGEFSKDGLTGFAKAGYGTMLRRSKSRSVGARDRHLRKLAEHKLQSRLAGNSKQALSVSDLGVYAPVVERGDARRHHRAHPFMIPSYKAESPRIEQSILDAAKTGIAEAGFEQ